MIFTHPSDEHLYREQTARKAQCHGVTMPSFVCVACRRRSVTKGCKRLSVGRICEVCKLAREAKQCSR